MAVLNAILNPNRIDPTKPLVPMLPGRFPMTPPIFGEDQNIPGSSAPMSAPAAPETSPHSSEPFPATPQSSALDQVMNARKAVDALGPEPTNVKPGWRNRLAAMLAAGAAGWNHQPGEGAAEAQRILNMPTERAQADWKAQEAKALQAENEAVQNFNLGLSQSRDTREIAAEKNLEQERQDTAAYRKQQAENQAARDQATEKYRQNELDLERQRLGKPSDPAQIAFQMSEVDATGKSTPAAMQAKRAWDAMEQSKLNDIHAARDPNEKARLLVDFQTNRTAIRSQIEREVQRLQTDPIASRDPAVQAQIRQYQADIQSIDKDLNYIHGELGSMGGFTPPSTRPAPPRPKNVPPNAVFDMSTRQWRLPTPTPRNQ